MAGAAPAAPVPASLSDARILPVLRDAAGIRYRSTRSASDQAAEVIFPDLPIEGPRTASWMLKETGKLNIDPTSRHQTWKHENGLKEEQKVCYTHEMLSDILELALTYDQLDGSNLASIEQTFRYLQDVEQEVRRKSEANKDFSVSQSLKNSAKLRKSKRRKRLEAFLIFLVATILAPRCQCLQHGRQSCAT